MPRIEPLRPHRHNVRDFRCRERFFTDYLTKKDRGLSHITKRLNVIYVAVEEDDPEAIQGFMTLSMGHITREQLDESVRGGLPNFSIPVLYLGLLATDERFVGQGVAKRLVFEAMMIAVVESEKVGCYALQLEAWTDDLISFYEKLGFIRMSQSNRLLFLPVRTIISGLESG